MKIRRWLGVALSSAGLAVLSCSADRGRADVGADASVALATDVVVESADAAKRIEEVRERFRALGAAVATRFEAVEDPDAATHVRAVLPADALRGVSRSAHVALPVRADGDVKLEDDTSHVSVRFLLEHMQSAYVEVAGGMALYRGALDGADVIHRVHAEGTEDFVVFETRPAREELSYQVDVSRVSGLRLVSNTLEFLDEGGTPVLRVAPPYVVDARGQRHDATLGVTGCAYDTNPAGPWGREVTRAGAARCRVRIAWGAAITYPAMVDPAWGATGSMATARAIHTASLLPSGKVLVAAGSDSGNFPLASAELYDPAANAGAGTFAATGSMATKRYMHSASVLLSGKVLIAGGLNPSVPPYYLASAVLYDPAAGTFAATGAMSTGRYQHTASVLPSGKVLIAGGAAAGPATLATAEIFDPAGNAGVGAFVATGPMAGARANHAATVLPSGKVLVAGGCSIVNCGTSISTAELYDPAGNAGAGTFGATGSLATARGNHTASLLPSGKVLVTGGCNAANCGTTIVAAELYDPAGNAGAGTFGTTGSMGTSRQYHTASVLPSGKVLVAGGRSSAYLASAEIFDPAGNSGVGTFAVTTSLANPRGAHSATVLPSGKVLVAGGAGASAELFGGVAGDPCAAGGNCFSGFCADGFCCNAACNGSCDRCDLAGKEGTCTIAPLGTTASPTCAQYACDGSTASCPASCASDAGCAAASYCAPDGTCQPRKAQAAACNTQVDCKEPGCRECASGACADGVCCDKPCTGQCEACDATAGVCGPIVGAPHGSRPACPPGNACSAATQQCEVGIATCDGDHTTTGADGTKQDCAPYRCLKAGTCGLACASVADCAAPAICDASGKCVAPTTGNDAGCAMSARGVAEEGRGLVWLALALLAAVAKRRRARRSQAWVVR